MGLFSARRRAQGACDAATRMCFASDFQPAVAASRSFRFEELAAATGDFCFRSYIADWEHEGHVYRGTLEGGCMVAVKVAKDEAAFLSEVRMLGKIKSPGFVSLIGQCEEKRLLVYEYPYHGTLDWKLSAPFSTIAWAARKKISIGVARALYHLHNTEGICHGDLCSNRVFLTRDFAPSLSCMCYGSQEAFKQEIPLRPGFSAPEVVQNDGPSQEADIYALGVILLELVTGRKAYDSSRAPEHHLLTDWARPMLASLDIRGLIDPAISNQHDHYELFSILSIASLCLRNDPSSRPSASKVLNLLDEEEDRGIFSDGDVEENSSSTSHVLSPASDKKKRLVVAHCLSYNQMLH